MPGLALHLRQRDCLYSQRGFADSMPLSQVTERGLQPATSRKNQSGKAASHFLGRDNANIHISHTGFTDARSPQGCGRFIREGRGKCLHFIPYTITICSQFENGTNYTQELDISS